MKMRLRGLVPVLGAMAMMLPISHGWTVVRSPVPSPAASTSPFVMPAHRFYVQDREPAGWRLWSGPFSEDNCVDELVEAQRQYPHRTFRCERFPVVGE